MAENKGILPSSTFNTLGNNSNKWEAVYANKLVGPLTGNAATATKATQDSEGQQINTTYIKGLSLSKTNLTYTKGNGSTGTVTLSKVAGFPSDTFIELDTSLTEYTAPANGYLCWQMNDNSNQTGFLHWGYYDISLPEYIAKSVAAYTYCEATSGSYGFRGYLPIRKGKKAILKKANKYMLWLRFIYAEGEV